MTFDLYWGHRGQGQYMQNFKFFSFRMLIGLNTWYEVRYLWRPRSIQFEVIWCTLRSKGTKCRHEQGRDCSARGNYSLSTERLLVGFRFNPHPDNRGIFIPQAHIFVHNFIHNNISSIISYDIVHQKSPKKMLIGSVKLLDTYNIGDVSILA